MAFGHRTGNWSGRAGYLLAFSLILSICPARAEKCKKLTPAKEGEICRYLQAKYQMPEESPIKLESAKLMPNSCVQELEFSSNRWSRNVVLYLPGDQLSLSPSIMDMRIKPASLNVGDEHDIPRKYSDVARTLERAPGRPVLGNSKAPVTIVLFSDFQCPYCKTLSRTLEEEIFPADKDRVKVVFRFYPLPRHDWAESAARAAYCASQQGTGFFWKLEEEFFRAQEEINPLNISEHLTHFFQQEPGIDQKAAEDCMSAPISKQAVEEDIALGNRYGVRVTPTMFINGVKLEGSKSAPDIERAVIAANALKAH